MKYGRNYAKLREIMAHAICRELQRKEGHWPYVQAKARKLLANDDLCSFPTWRLRPSWTLS